MNTDLKNIPQKVELISKAEIRSLPSENLADLLKRKTNLDIVQYTGMSSSVGMRGFSPTAHSRSYTLLLINGLPSGTTNMASIETENIERIEIIKGPYSVLYGSDAMGGVINIITESASEEQNGSISLAAGSFGTFKFSGDLSAKVGEKTNFDLGFSRRQQNQDYRIGTNNILKLSGTEKNILDPASYGDTMINSRYKLNHLNGGLRTQLNERWSIGAQAMYTMANEVETPGTYWGTYGESKKEINRLNLYGKLQRNSGRNIFDFNPYFTSENNPNYTDNSDSGFVSFISHVKEFGFKMHDNINVGDFQVLFGADLDVYHYSSDRYSDATTPATPYVPNHRNSKGAIFTHLAYTKGGLLVNAGARLNKLTYKIEANESLNGSGGKEGYFAFNPSAGIQYALPVGLKFHGSFGTAFSVPDAFKVAGSYSVSEYFAEWDFWWISNYVGNQDLKPESSATYDIGLRYSAPNQLISADVTYFQTNHNNKIIEYNMGGDTVSYRNANDSRMSGIELNFTSNLGELFDHRFKLELYANYTGMLKNEVDETLSGSLGQDSTVTRHMLYTRKSNGNFGVLFDSYSGFSTRLHVRHMGPRLELDNFSLLRPDISPGEYYTRGGYTEADMILKHSAHLVFDYSIYYTLLSHYRVGITISNLLNENYSEKDGYNMTGRMITGSLRYSF
jgi:outer membrane receptor protein involved in Fe transport